MSMIRKSYVVLAFGALALLIVSASFRDARAADLTQFSAPASGSDMWNGMMGRSGAYTPHPNNCDVSTEAFIQVASAPDGVALGLCFDKDEQTAAGWVDARHTCLAAKKRLPEPGEFSYACSHGTGLNNMTDNYEWASNFSSNDFFDAITPRQGVGAPVIGNGSCTTAAIGVVASNDNAPSSLAFRCVH